MSFNTSKRRFYRLLIVAVLGSCVVFTVFPLPQAVYAVDMPPQLIVLDGGGYDDAGASAVDAGGNLYVTGSVESGTSQSSFAAAKYNPQGNLLWRSHYSGPQYGRGLAIAVDNQGNVYVAGYISDGVIFNSNIDFLTVKFDRDGVQQWARAYDGPVKGYDQATEIAVDQQDDIYVSGSSYGLGNDLATLKYSPSGALLWERRYTGFGSFDDRVSDMVLDSAGDLVITGTTENTGDGETNDIVTVKYNPQGTVLWERAFTETSISHEFANDLDVDGNGNIYITGTTQENFSPYVPPFPITLKYDRNGNLLRTIRGQAAGGAAIDADSAGNFCVVGFFPNPDLSFRWFEAKYDVNGDNVWATPLAVPSGSFLGEMKLLVDSVGNIFVAGTLRDLSTIASDYLTIKCAPNGSELWQNRFNGTGNRDDNVAAISRDSTDNIYVTGTSWGDYVTLGGTADDIVTLRFVSGSIPPPSPPPLAPTNLRATATSSIVIRLNWTDQSNDETGFKIERCQDAGCTNFVEIAQVARNASSYYDAGLARNKVYNYRVRAFNVFGDSPYSNTASAKTRNK
jgi:uncharacterized delta-60 repeat protein